MHKEEKQALEKETNLNRIARKILERDAKVVVIEGPCGAGKSTLADRLSSRLKAVVVHMDDFYLPRDLPRAPFDGNSDLSRIRKEVLEPFLKNGKMTYRPFSPQEQKLLEPVSVQGERLILEGNYSMHPALFDLADYAIWLQVDESEQQKRLAKRSPQLLERFNKVWIPDTLRYFDHYGIIDKADIHISAQANDYSPLLDAIK